MPKLSEKQIAHITELLEAGSSLPEEYRALLFPPNQYELIYNDESLEDVLESQNQKGKHTVLIVDDNPDNRALLADQLDFQGYNTAEAANGKEAVDVLKQRSFDLVLLDIMMPVMNGYETLEYMKQDDSLGHIPVIMISAVDDIQSVAKCIQLGAEDYLPKPFNATLLRARVDASIERKVMHDKEQAFLERLKIERQKSEDLLRNILPLRIAERLKERPETIADSFADVTVLFADIVDFTRLSVSTSPGELVEMLNSIFSAIDALAETHQLEKIKTIGDAYMVVGGLPDPRPDHAKAVAEMALDIQEAISKFKTPSGTSFQMRIGINTGPVIAGVIGKKKFIYDLWGDAVNVASRMESLALPGTIQVTEDVHKLIEDQYIFEERGLVSVKGRGEMPTYLLKERIQHK